MKLSFGSKWLRSCVCALAALLAGLTGDAWAAPVQLVVNGEFESPSAGSGYIVPDEASVPGWSTDATDGKMEIWGQGFSGSPANGSDGLPSGQHLELNANGQANVWHTQVLQLPRTPRVDFSFDHWARGGGDNVTWEVIGSESGVLDSGTVNAASGVWGRQAKTFMRTGLEEEITLRFKTNSQAHLDQVSLRGYRAVTGDTLLIDETFTAQLPTGSSASPRWFDNDPAASFEVYNVGGAAARNVSSTYDHDSDPSTPQINLVGAIEVNGGPGKVTLTAELRLPSTLDASLDGDLSFFAAHRGALGTGLAAPTVSIFNVTDNRSILDPTDVLFNSDVRVWELNNFLVDFIEDDAGDLIQVHFYGGGIDGASGLEMTDLIFAVATVPEPGTLALLVLGGVGLGVVARRRRRKQHQS